MMQAKEQTFIFTVNKAKRLPFSRKVAITEELTLEHVLQLAVETWAEKMARQHSLEYYSYEISENEEAAE